MERENAKLQETIDKENEELAQIQSEYKDLEQQVEELLKNENKLKEEIINLNEQIIAIKNPTGKPKDPPIKKWPNITRK